MATVSLRELQLFELEMLKDIKRVCDNNGICYYLYSGTCLGAVRHQGFIPWDDDIDIAMPYSDYLHFLEIAQQDLGSDYFLQTTDTDDSFQFGYARVRRNHTTMIRDWELSEGHHGIWIDVFPLIYVGGKADVRMKKFLIPITNLLCTSESAYNNAKDWLIECNGRVKVVLVTAVRKLMGKRRKPIAKWIRRKLYAQGKKANMAEAWGSITAVVPAQAFDGPAAFLPFEDDVFPVPPDYDCMLRYKYGDYMQLPPEENRHSNHGEVTIDLTHDWEELKQLGLASHIED